MPLTDFVGEIFVQLIWEGALRFVGACIRFIFTKESFAEALKNEKSSSIGFAFFLLVLTVFIIWFLD